MSNANKWLPLIEQRNKKRNKLMTKINDSLLRDLSSATIHNYHGSFEQKQQPFQKFMLSKNKDQETITLAKKYLAKFQQKKKSLGKIVCLSKNSPNKYKVQNIKTNQAINYEDIKQRQKLIKIQTLINSLSISRKQQKSPVSNDKDNSTIPHLPCEQMRRMKSILLSSERRKSHLKLKEELIDNYGSLKNNLSKSLQNQIKINKYKSSRYNNQDTFKVNHKKMLTEHQHSVNQIVKNPQKSYKYEYFDDEDNPNFKTLDQTKYKYFKSPKILKFDPLKPSRVKSQNCSKKNLSYNLDRVQPWESYTEQGQIQ